MSAENAALNLEKTTVVLLDVAGTTTSLNFVKETLFPFAIKEAAAFLKDNFEDEAVKEAVKLLKDGADLDVEAAAAAIKELTESDSDNKGLKTLQGLIYKKGYESGDLKAHVFDDVPAALEDWAKNRKIAIYSTGSVEAQKLLFAHTVQGDLSSHIAEYFDQTVIGLKTDSASYEKVAKALDVKTADIFFITDLIEEAKSAKSAGLIAAVIKREAADEVKAEDQHVISSFKEVSFENPAKRKNEDPAVVEEAPPTKVAKTDEPAKVVEAVVEEAMEVDAAAVAEKKEEVKVVEKEEEKKVVEEVVEKKVVEAATPEEAKPIETPVVEEKKDDEKKEEVAKVDDVIEAEVAEEPKTNGDKKEEVVVEENGKKEEAVEEKENSSELANGIKGAEEKEKVQEEEKESVVDGEVASDEATEKKVRKIEGGADSATAVPVEV